MNVRHATPEDAAAIAAVVTELSYPASVADAARRLAGLTDPAVHGVFVAVDGDRPVGVIHVCVTMTLEHDPRAEIRALIVEEAARGRGVGAELVGAAERWARERGLDRVRVRSNVKRERARKFYERLGYRVTKAQNVFDKKLSDLKGLRTED